MGSLIFDALRPGYRALSPNDHATSTTEDESEMSTGNSVPPLRRADKSIPAPMARGVGLRNNPLVPLRAPYRSMRNERLQRLPDQLITRVAESASA